MPEPLGTTAGRWVLLSYRMPREPSTPGVEVGRALRRLGVVQLLDGLVALPEDSRTREQFEWIADQVLEAGGEAAIWLSVPATRAQERALAERMRAAVAGDYRLLSGQAEDALDAEPVARRRALRRLRRQMRALRRRDYFPPAERELVSGLALVKAVFRGVGPAVLAIVAIAAVKLARSTNERDPVLWAIAGVLCAVTAIAGAESVWMFLLAGAFGAVYYGGGLPRVRAAASVSPLGLLAAVQGFAWTGSGASLGARAVFFAKAGAFTFGSGLAIVPFLHQGLVADHGWLTDQQFLDAVAMGLITPGPVVIMVTFAGYLVFGLTGAIVATAARRALKSYMLSMSSRGTAVSETLWRLRSLRARDRPRPRARDLLLRGFAWPRRTHRGERRRPPRAVLDAAASALITFPVGPSEAPVFERIEQRFIAAARERLGREHWEAASAVGRSMTADAATAFALEPAVAASALLPD